MHDKHFPCMSVWLAAYIWFSAHMSGYNLCMCQRWFLSPKQGRICCTDCRCLRCLCRCVILLSRDSSWACALMLQHWKNHVLQQILSLHGLLHKHDPRKHLPLMEQKGFFFFFFELDEKTTATKQSKKQHVYVFRGPIHFLCWSIVAFELIDDWIHSWMSQKKAFGTNLRQWPMFTMIFASWQVEFCHITVKWLRAVIK